MMTFCKGKKFLRQLDIFKNRLRDASPSHDYQFFNQKLDHFNSSDNRTFLQRYVVNEDFYSNSHILIVLFDGEWTLTPGDVELETGGFTVYLAEKYGALLTAVEHRFYGLSIPGFPGCEDACLDVDHLQYLTSQQALNDLSMLIDYLKTDLWKSKDIRKVVVVGGSYAGAMAVWMRTLYPHVVDAALASSGPINATEDFYQYDQSIALGLNDSVCASLIREAVAQSDISIDANFTDVRDRVGCTQMTDASNGDNLRYALTDAVAHAVQYNRETGTARQQMRKNLCDIMKKEDGSSSEDKYYEFFNSLMANMSTDCVGWADTAESMNNTSGDEFDASRQWYWQSCREFGFFQTAPTIDSLRSPRINLQYHRDLCAAVFNESYSTPDTAATNACYGGVNPRGTSIDFTNGEFDPWHVLSVFPTTTTAAAAITAEEDQAKEKENSITPLQIHLSQAANTSARSVSAASVSASASVGGMPVNDTDGHVERQDWRVYLIKDGSHCNDLRQPNTDTISPYASQVQVLVEADLRRWLGYLDPTTHDYFTPIQKNTTTNHLLDFVQPILIVGVGVFLVGVIVLIVGICIAWRMYKQQAKDKSAKADSASQPLVEYYTG